MTYKCEVTVSDQITAISLIPLIDGLVDVDATVLHVEDNYFHDGKGRIVFLILGERAALIPARDELQKRLDAIDDVRSYTSSYLV